MARVLTGTAELASTPASAPAEVGDRLFGLGTGGFALLVLGLMLAILAFLFAGALPALRQFGWHFFVSSEWNPVSGEFGAASSILGTLATSLVALVVAVPVSFGVAVFLNVLCPHWLRRPVGVAVELLAGIPSVIYGIWGLFVFAPLFADRIQPALTDWFGGLPLVGGLFDGPPIGLGWGVAGFVLGVMVIPFIAAVMRDVLATVPRHLIESAYALGATHREVIWNVLVPSTRRGLAGGIILGLGRALGETMAVTFLVGNAHNVTFSLFEPGNTIASTIANEFSEASGDLHVSVLIALGFTLFAITIVVLSVANAMLRRSARKEAAA
ncbi:phosphate ABC transporter permease subunit PstC [Nitrogeniibacter mangrovi]|uniref:phosphate ABC transporter permease subunit PstC n=1 Tax=Nitrogeniibacter mangrovi TaxID=2016596 RepID=UPI001E538FAB|nr:phosphate ABC transporter permease subunit PstC [Nitrogeniibacter mangrovi]